MIETKKKRISIFVPVAEERVGQALGWARGAHDTQARGRVSWAHGRQGWASGRGARGRWARAEGR